MKVRLFNLVSLPWQEVVGIVRVLEAKAEVLGLLGLWPSPVAAGCPSDVGSRLEEDEAWSENKTQEYIMF
jgi:hypothetical protein